MTALHGEVVVRSSDNGTLALTNYRVTFDASGTGASRYVSIPLDAVSSCGLVTRSNPLLLVLVAGALIVALAPVGEAARYVLLAAAFCFFVGYFIGRSAVITISSSGGEQIVVPASGMSRTQIIPFLEAILTAKLELLGKLKDGSVSAQSAAHQLDPAETHRQGSIEAAQRLKEKGYTAIEISKELQKWRGLSVEDAEAVLRSVIG